MFVTINLVSNTGSFLHDHPSQRLMLVKCLTIIQIELEFGNVGFWGEGKTGVLTIESIARGSYSSQSVVRSNLFCGNSADQHIPREGWHFPSHFEKNGCQSDELIFRRWIWKTAPGYLVWCCHKLPARISFSNLWFFHKLFQIFILIHFLYHCRTLLLWLEHFCYFPMPI